MEDLDFELAIVSLTELKKKLGMTCEISNTDAPKDHKAH
jgi:hypothetical protein